MVLPRPSTLGGVFRSQATRTAGSRARAQVWQQFGRRSYASGHGPVKASSDIPWLLGSIAFTVPSAAWLWQQGPEKTPHGHGHGAEQLHLTEEAPEEKGEESSSEDEGSTATPESSDDEPEKVSDGGESNEGTSSESDAMHPSMDDPEKSTKGEGVAETAKISGTVDTSRDQG